MKAHIYFATGFEEIEALTVVDVLRRADFTVTMISVTNALYVTGSHSIEVKTDLLYADVDHDDADIMILPGGPGTQSLIQHEQLKQQLLYFAKSGKWIAAICAAPMILGVLGILNGEEATCYPGYEKYLEGAKLTYESVVCSGNIITGRGAGVTVYFALKIIEKLVDENVALELKAKMIVP